MKKESIKERYKLIIPHFDEKRRRLWCASEAMREEGGISIVHRATGVSRTTITNGIKELKKEKDLVENKRIRKGGGGRKKAVEKDKALSSDLEKLVNASTRGDPESPLKWTSKSTYKLAEELNKHKKRVSDRLVSRRLKTLGYSLQSNKKTKEGSHHPDRNEQFEFINEKTKQFIKAKNPVISVDTKKKENVGNYKNKGQEYAKKGTPVEVNGHEFPNKTLGKVVPYGIYDIENNKGWVSVGISSDTARFAVNSIRSWWKNRGEKRYPNSTALYINADGGGSNGWRTRLWKTELQKFATEIGMKIHVSHFPPGTSKWNKIEHKMFSFISKNWRGKPLLDRTTVVNLIGNTTTKTGLKIYAELDEKCYEKGIKISDEELAQVHLQKEEFHGEWNYIISPDM